MKMKLFCDLRKGDNIYILTPIENDYKISLYKVTGTNILRDGNLKIDCQTAETKDLVYVCLSCDINKSMYKRAGVYECYTTLEEAQHERKNKIRRDIDKTLKQISELENKVTILSNNFYNY